METLLTRLCQYFFFKQYLQIQNSSFVTLEENTNVKFDAYNFVTKVFQYVYIFFLANTSACVFIDTERK